MTPWNMRILSGSILPLPLFEGGTFSEADAIAALAPNVRNEGMVLFAAVAFSFLFAFLSAAVVILIWRKRMEAKNNAVYKALPGRIAVCDRNERILFLRSGDHPSGKMENIRYLCDFQTIDYDKISRAVHSVFESGKSITIDYGRENIKRSMTISPLAHSIFGTDAVIWFSHDNSELQNARDRAEELAAENMENLKKIQAAAKTWNLVTNALPVQLFAQDADNGFRYVLGNAAFLECVRLSEKNLVGKTDSDLFPPSVASEQLRLGRALLAGDVSAAECTQEIIDADGIPHLLRMIRRILVTEDGKKLLFGAGVDITELEESKRKEAESRMLLQSLLDTLPVGIVVKDAMNEFRILKCNPFFCRLSGKTEAELLGKNDAELPLIPGHAEEIRRQDEETVRSGKIHHFTGKTSFIDAEPRVLERVKVPLQLSDGRSLLVTALMDVTDLHAFIENEKMLNECFEMLMMEKDDANAIPSALQIVRKHFSVSAVRIGVFRNNQFVPLYETENSPFKISELPTPDNDLCKMRLQKRELVISRDLSAADSAQDLPCALAALAGYGVRALCACGIFRGSVLSGALILLDTKPRSDLGETNLNIMLATAHLFELALERDSRRKELIAALDAAKAADKAKSYFIASVSHEIRTPLNAVIGFTELLRNGTPDTKTRDEYLDSISYSGNALLLLINDVLDLSKLEAGQMKMEIEPVDFPTLCAEAAGIFRYSSDIKNLYLHIRVSSMPFLLLDKIRIRQILCNLIGNAVKFTLKGGITIQGSFLQKNTNSGLLTFSVEDTGCGISAENQKALFEPFVQLESSYRGTHAANNGTGLGLAISKRLAEQMKGKITLESEVGRGSRFTVELPDIPFETEKNKDAKPTEIKFIPGSCVSSILIVDDVPLNIKVLEAMLQNLPCRIRSATSGADALELMKQAPADLVLTDLWMPGMNGAELAAEIRKNPQWKNTRIAAVTADIESGMNFDTAMFDAVISKPITFSKLRSAVERCSPKN